MGSPLFGQRLLPKAPLRGITVVTLIREANARLGMLLSSLCSIVPPADVNSPPAQV